MSIPLPLPYRRVVVVAAAAAAGPPSSRKRGRGGGDDDGDDTKRMLYTRTYVFASVCCVCVAAFGDGDAMVLASCGHQMHDACTRQWHTASRTFSCPLCRHDISKGVRPASSRRRPVDALAPQQTPPPPPAPRPPP